MQPKVQVPYLSKKKIIELSKTWLDSLEIKVFENQSLDLNAIFEHLNKTHGLIYNEISLGGVQNKKILGVMIPAKNAIYIDPILTSNLTMKRFTQAHELAHWILHRKLDLSDYELSDTTETLNQARKLVTTYDWIEWQANAYAAMLLMPITRFKAVLDHSLDLLDINTEFKLIQPFQLSKLLKVLAFKFEVSQSVVSIHLQTLQKENVI